MKQSMAPSPWDGPGTAVLPCSAALPCFIWEAALVNTPQSQQNTATFSCAEKQLVCIEVVALPRVKVKLLTPNGLIHC